MLTIIETLWRTLVLLWASIVQLFAALFGGIGLLLSKVCMWLRRYSGKVLKTLDKGKYERKMRSIAE